MNRVAAAGEDSSRPSKTAPASSSVETRDEAQRQHWLGPSWLLYGDLVIPVTVLDVKRAFGRRDLLVTPVAGSGQQWLCSSKFVKPKEGKK